MLHGLERAPFFHGTWCGYLFPSYPLTKTAKESLAGSLRQNARPNSRKERLRGEGWRLNRVQGDCLCGCVCVAVDPGQASTDANRF